MSTLKERLRAVDNVLATKDQWCRGSFAIDASGHSVEWSSPRAVCFCLAGAIYRAIEGQIEDPLWPEKVNETRNAIVEAIEGWGYGCSITNFNDMSEFDAVKRIISLAIEKAA